MSEKILVTGAAGFIGYHLCKSLLDDNYEVLGIDNINDYYDPKLKHARLDQLTPYKNFTFEKINIANRKPLTKAFTDFKPNKVVNLAAQASSLATLDTKLYNYQKENDITGLMASWREEVFNPVYHRGGANARLRIKDCEGNEKPLNIHDSALYVRLPQEFLEKLTTVPKIVEFRDFSDISNEEFRNRIYHETETVISGTTPYPTSRLPLQNTDQVPNHETGLLMLDLKAAKVWKDKGRSEFQLRQGKKIWQTFITDGDGMAVMRLPIGKYYLRVGAFLEKTFFLEKDKELKLNIR